MKLIISFLAIMSVTCTVTLKANEGNLPPVAVISNDPGGEWFYNAADVVFSMSSSYDPDGGYINYTKWYINGVYQTGGSYGRNMPTCFVLHGEPNSSGCYELGQGISTVTVKLELRDNAGDWSSTTKTYSIKKHKGRRYFVKDHLGSVRATVNRDGNVLVYDDYYPFGLVMPGRSSNSANPNDNYKFTGHEFDDEAGLNLIHAGARMMDPVLGIWTSIDPLASKFPGLSPYNYAVNNPLMFSDPNGKDVTVGFEDEESRQAFIEFINTQEGMAFISLFAKAGKLVDKNDDSIVYAEFEEDGIYSNNDLDFFDSDNYGEPAGSTSYSFFNEDGEVSRSDFVNGFRTVGKNSRLRTSIMVSAAYKSEDMDRYGSSVFGLAETLSHEAFFHAARHAPYLINFLQTDDIQGLKEYATRQSIENRGGRADHADVQKRTHPLLGNYIRALRQIKNSLNNQ